MKLINAVLFKNTLAVIFAVFLMAFGSFSASADEFLKPFIHAYDASGSLKGVQNDIENKLASAGFEVVG